MYERYQRCGLAYGSRSSRARERFTVCSLEENGNLSDMGYAIGNPSLGKRTVLVIISRLGGSEYDETVGAVLTAKSSSLGHRGRRKHGASAKTRKGEDSKRPHPPFWQVIHPAVASVVLSILHTMHIYVTCAPIPQMVQCLPLLVSAQYMQLSRRKPNPPLRLHVSIPS